MPASPRKTGRRARFALSRLSTDLLAFKFLYA